METGESQMAFTTTCDFIHQFFKCEECIEHFYNMCSSVSTPFSSKREYVVWLWTAHNEVNKRLPKNLLKPVTPNSPKQSGLQNAFVQPATTTIIKTKKAAQLTGTMMRCSSS
ncbi:putative thiol oxidase [Helianthus debilis subsp. tardiflorus]